MFAGNLFYKDIQGEIRELTIEFLYDKIVDRLPCEDAREEAENLLSVISYYVQSRKKDLLVSEVELDELIERLIPGEDESRDRQFSAVETNRMVQGYLKQNNIALPQEITASLENRMNQAAAALKKNGVTRLSGETFENILSDLLTAMGITNKKRGRLIFPIDEILLIYSKYSPFSAGDYFNEVVNHYLYRNFLLDSDVKEAEKNGLLINQGLEPFKIDRLDVFSGASFEKKREMDLAGTFIFYNEALYRETPVGKKVLFRMKNIDDDIPSVVYADEYEEPGENTAAFTFQKNENYSLFSLDETAFPVYPSFYNAELDFAMLAELDAVSQLEALDNAARGLNRFYQKYSEYFYLVSLLKKRNLYMNVIIYGDAPEYSHLLTTYFRRKVDNEHIRFIIRNRSGDTDVKKLISRGGEGYPVELRVDRDLWNERLHSLCKKNRVYLVSFDERGLL